MKSYTAPDFEIESAEADGIATLSAVSYNILANGEVVAKFESRAE